MSNGKIDEVDAFAIYFASVRAAIIAFKSDPGSINVALKSGGSRTSKSMRWCYAHEPTEEAYRIIVGGLE